MSTLNTWTPTSGTLWATTANWSQSRIPITNDYVSISGSTNLPTTGPSVSVTLAGFDTSGVTTNWNSTGSFALTNNIVIAANGVLKIGNPSHSSNHHGWSGNCSTNSNIAAILFNGRVTTSLSFAGCSSLTLSGDTQLTTSAVNNIIYQGASGQSGGTYTGFVIANTIGTIDNQSGNLDFSGVTLATLLQPLSLDISGTGTVIGGPVTATPVNDNSQSLGPVSSITLSTGTQWYVSTTGNDSNTGLSWSQAFATLSHAKAQMNTSGGDTLNIGAGTFAQGSTQFLPPAYSAVIGAGGNNQATIITSTVINIGGHVAVCGWSGGIMKSVCIDTTAANVTNQNSSPFGSQSSDPEFVGMYLEDCKIHGYIDANFITSHSTGVCSFTAVDCWFGSNYDSWAVTSCIATVIGGSTNSINTIGGNQSRGTDPGSSTLTFINHPITAANALVDTEGISSGGGCVTNLINSPVSATSSSGTVWAINATAGLVNTWNSPATGPTTGNIVAATSAAQLIGNPIGAPLTITTANGSFIIGANYPSVLDVRSAVGVGASVGGLSVPLASNVKAGIYFGEDANGSTDGSYYAIQVSNPPVGNNFYGYCYAVSTGGVPQTGVIINYAMTVPPVGSGEAFNGSVQNVTSDSNGLVSMPMDVGATFVVWSGEQTPQTIVIPANAVSPYAIPNFTFIVC